jgi:ATP-dependent RNA helicase DDX18/HAS1
MEGYRAYLRSYASYSLKKIFDVNQLDLAKVGKAFGFAVPPRVNLNVIGGAGGSNGSAESKNKKKRKRVGEDDDEEDVELEEMEVGGGADEDDRVDFEEEESSRKNIKHRDQSKKRRTEVLGHKKVQKEMYRKEKNRQKNTEGGKQWSR